MGHTSRNCELTPRCFNCGKVGHATRNCFQPKRLAAMSHEQRNGGRRFKREFHQSGQNANDTNERSESDVNTRFINPSVKTIHEEVMTYVVHDRENCQECNRTAKRCHAMLASELTLECGCKLPIVADACQVHNERMMGGQSVKRYRMFNSSGEEGVSG